MGRKRPHGHGGDPGSKKRRQGEAVAVVSRVQVRGPDDPALNAYAAWAVAVGCTVSQKVAFSSASISGRAMVATTDIAEGEVLFEIPRAVLLTPNARHGRASAVLTSYSGQVRPTGDEPQGTEVHDPASPTSGNDSDNESDSATSGDDGDTQASLEETDSGWTPLLLALMVEHTTPASFWDSYLAVLPALNALPHPHFWPLSERERLLQGHPLLRHLQQDMDRIHHEYEKCALPFIRAHPEMFDPVVHTAELYTRLAAIVMAYSFTDDKTGLPALVPLADLLNHQTGSNNARLFYDRQALQMLAVKPIAAGQELFNTYGSLSSTDLLRKYGFVEHTVPVNPFEEVEITLSDLVATMDSSNALPLRDEYLRSRKEKFLIDRGFITDPLEPFFLCPPWDDSNLPVATDDFVAALHPRLQVTLMVCCMDADQLDAFECSNPVALESDDEDSGGGSDEDSDEEDARSDDAEQEKHAETPGPALTSHQERRTTDHDQGGDSPPPLLVPVPPPVRQFENHVHDSLMLKAATLLRLTLQRIVALSTPPEWPGSESENVATVLKRNYCSVAQKLFEYYRT